MLRARLHGSGGKHEMGKIEIGQEREFFEATRLDGKTIDKGTRVRVGYIARNLHEARVIVVVLGAEPPETLTMPRHILMLHSVPLGRSG
jgi:hypothetical protein